MTTVYGVTMFGAKAQIKRQLLKVENLTFEGQDYETVQ